MGDKTCFFIAPIGDRETPVRKRSDQVLKHLVRFVAEPLGYSVERADELSDEGLITNHIIDRLVESQLVVADLTGRNPNVFYELAVRHAAHRPVVHLIQFGDDIPFDVANMRAVHYSLDDPDSVVEAQTQLRRKIQAVDTSDEAGPNPISAALQLRSLQTSSEPEKEALGAVLSEIADLRLEITKLTRRLTSMPAELSKHRPQVPLTSVTVGAAVRHAVFGEGRVTELEPGGVVLVRFADGANKKLMWDHAPINTVVASDYPEDDLPLTE